MSEREVFHVQEGSFEVPAGFADRSVEVLEWEEPAGERFSLSVARQARAEGKSLREIVEAQIRELEESMGPSEILGVAEGEASGVPVIEVRHRWVHEDGVVHNHHAFVGLPARLLVFTLATRPRNAARAAEIIEGLLETFEPREGAR